MYKRLADLIEGYGVFVAAAFAVGVHAFLRLRFPTSAPAILGFLAAAMMGYGAATSTAGYLERRLVFPAELFWARLLYGPVVGITVGAATYLLNLLWYTLMVLQGFDV